MHFCLLPLIFDDKQRLRGGSGGSEENAGEEEAFFLLSGGVSVSSGNLLLHTTVHVIVFRCVSEEVECVITGGVGSIKELEQSLGKN